MWKGERAVYSNTKIFQARALKWLEAGDDEYQQNVHILWGPEALGADFAKKCNVRAKFLGSQTTGLVHT